MTTASPFPSTGQPAFLGSVAAACKKNCRQICAVSQSHTSPRDELECCRGLFSRTSGAGCRHNRTRCLSLATFNRCKLYFFVLVKPSATLIVSRVFQAMYCRVTRPMMSSIRHNMSSRPKRDSHAPLATCRCSTGRRSRARPQAALGSAGAAGEFGRPVLLTGGPRHLVPTRRSSVTSIRAGLSASPRGPKDMGWPG